MFDIKALKESVQKELGEEMASKAKAVLKSKYKQLESAKAVVRNTEREIADLEASIEDGSFTG
jgi:hypothetical protein